MFPFDNVIMGNQVSTEPVLEGLTHWSLGHSGSNFKNILFKVIMQNSSLVTLCEIAVNYLVPSGKKPLNEPMLTQICVAIWLPYAAMS